MFGVFFELRITDVVDILLVTALLYTATVWLRRTQAGFVAAGIMLLGGLYVLARLLELRLTTWIFQGFLAIFVVVIVVIFQEELRQLFERLAMWSLRRVAPVRSRFQTSDVLVRCLSDFARDRIGALVVLPGRQPIQRYVRGGIELHGRVSLPLLKSIFDPHSPGHDGAVVIENDEVERFAAHLPLSKDFVQLTGLGTRHSAALGLAELTDALCVVASEERGQISIARDGRLRCVGDAQELASEIQRFVQERHPTDRPALTAIQLLRQNWIEKVASLALVLGLWAAFVPGSRPTEVTFRVPVTVVNLPAGLALEKVEPAEVSATFRAPRRAFYLFDSAGLAVSIDAALAQFGRRTFEITDRSIRYPKELNLSGIQPSEVKISVRRAGGSSGTGNEEQPAPQ